MVKKVAPQRDGASETSDEQTTLFEKKREANTFALPAGSSNYQTPLDFRAALDAIYNFDDWDPCPINSEGIRNFDGLGRTPVWVKKYFYNPPYDNVVPWLRNSIRDWERGVLSCALIKADTSTSWMHRPCLSLRTGYLGSGTPPVQQQGACTIQFRGGCI